jgi:molecular chaperone HtpG
VPLLRFHSSTQDTLVSLAEYCTRLAEGQKAIWYHVADTLDAARASVHLEAFRAHNIEVLLCTDPIDTFWPERMGEYEGKPLRSVTQATDADFPASGSGPENLAALVAALRVALGEAVSDVRQTSRLAESPCALATGPQGPDLHMQRLLRRAGRGEGSAPILEINPAHPLIHALASRSSDADLIGAIAPTLLDLARVQDGDLPSDPARFARVLAELLVTKLAGS